MFSVCECLFNSSQVFLDILSSLSVMTEEGDNGLYEEKKSVFRIIGIANSHEF